MEKLSNMEDIPIKLVAQILGKSPEFIRHGLQQKTLPIGCAVKMSTQWTYHISYELLKQYVGIERLNNYEKEKNKMA